MPAGAARAASGCLALAAGALVAVAVLGPSAAEAPLGRYDDGGTPPWHVAAGPSPWLVAALMTVAVLAGAGAVLLGLTGRWRPDPRRLTLAGVGVVAVLALLPPIGSADPLSYAAYGHAVITGHDPYAVPPDVLASRGDPVAAAVEVPWQHTPSVYGPLATAEQAAASALAGRDVAVTVLLLDLAGAVAFAATAWLLLRAAGDDAGRRRAALLWSANPLLWLQLGAGAHLDVLVSGLAAAAVVALRRSDLAAGALAGAAAAVKAPGGLVWLALAWAARQSRPRLARLAGGAALVALPAYAVAGTGALGQLSRASHLVSLATPWRPVLDATHAPRRLIGALALVLLVVMVLVLMRPRERQRASAAAAASVLALAYVLSAPYVLPWYDALPWVLTALAAATWRDQVLLAHTTVLSLAYIPGRAAVPLHGVLHALTSGMRTAAAPALLTALLLVVWGMARSRPAMTETCQTHAVP